MIKSLHLLFSILCFCLWDSCLMHNKYLAWWIFFYKVVELVWLGGIIITSLMSPNENQCQPLAKSLCLLQCVIVRASTLQQISFNTITYISFISHVKYNSLHECWYRLKWSDCNIKYVWKWHCLEKYGIADQKV